MSKFAILAIVFAIITINGYAQQSGYRYGDNYNSYYSPVTIGPNGFRTVEEENRRMTETLAQLRRQREADENTQEEMTRAKKRHDEEVAAKKSLFDAKKSGNISAKK
jgi:hypothetical protein